MTDFGCLNLLHLCYSGDGTQSLESGLQALVFHLSEMRHKMSYWVKRGHSFLIYETGLRSQGQGICGQSREHYGYAWKSIADGLGIFVIKMTIWRMRSQRPICPMAGAFQNFPELWAGLAPGPPHSLEPWLPVLLISPSNTRWTEGGEWLRTSRRRAGARVRGDG